MENENQEGTYLGIDLGTSNSVATFFKNGKFEQVEFKSNKRRKLIPSLIYFNTKEELFYGDKAFKKGQINPLHLLSLFKRDLGSDKKYTLNFDLDDTPKIIYTIDTNVFMNDPDILSSFGDDEEIYLPITVLSEISHRATQDETKIAANVALEKINEALAKDNVMLIESNRDLLPEDFYANSANDDNDNRILSVSLKVKNDNPNKKVKLITDDRGLQVKAKVVAIDFVSINQFRMQKNISEASNDSNTLVITPKQASSYLLKHIKEESEAFISTIITKAVITVPANFNQSQIELTKEAGIEAGFDEIRIMKEPIAAGLAYSVDREDEKKILVYDFGGGTFDATILVVSKTKLDVIGVHGDSKLGGEDITNIVNELIYDELEDKYDLSMFELEDSELIETEYNKNKSMIATAAESAKIELSESKNTTISIANLHTSNGNTINLNLELTREDFDDAIVEIRKKSLDVVKELISNSGLSASEIDMVVMAGGTSNIPSIYNSIKDTLGVDPHLNKDTAIVISEGAVIEAMQKWDISNVVQEEILYNDKALFDFGIGIKGYVFDLLIPINTSLPYRVEKVYTTERDNQESLEIKAFQRREGYVKSIKTHDRGIDFVDEVSIYNLPSSKVGEFKIKVIFELTKDDILAMTIDITDKSGSKINSADVKIKKASQE